jgi:hypothetical protein
MFSNFPNPTSRGAHIRGRLAVVLSAALIGTLATLPTASALASAPSAGPVGSGSAKRSALARALRAGPQVTPGELLPAGELEELLARLPLDDLGAAQLAHALAGLQGIRALAGLEGLLGKELGTAGLEKGLREAIEELKLADRSATLGELTNVEAMLPALEGKLGGLLETLLGPLLGAEQKEALEGALGTLDLKELTGSLLGSAAPSEQLATELSTLAGGLLGELQSAELENLLGSKLGGGFAPKSVKEVSEELKSTPKAVSEELGESTTQLPETTTMLTAPLTDGKLMGIAPAVKGLALGLLGSGAGEGGKGSGEEGGEGSGSGSGEGGNGSGTGEGSGEGGQSSGSGSGQGGGGGTSGSQGGSGEGGHGGQGGSTGGMTILLTLPTSPTKGASAATERKLGNLRILSHRVRGRVATIALEIPAAGRIALTGRGLRPVHATAAKAERLTLRATLSPAAAASLRRGHRPLRVRIEASFTPHAGAGSHSGSSAGVVVSFG